MRDPVTGRVTMGSGSIGASGTQLQAPARRAMTWMQRVRRSADVDMTVAELARFVGRREPEVLQALMMVGWVVDRGVLVVAPEGTH